MNQKSEEDHSLLTKVDFFSEEFDDEEDLLPETINEEYNGEAAATPMEEPEKELPEGDNEENSVMLAEDSEMPMELDLVPRISEIEQAKREFRAYMDYEYSGKQQRKSKRERGSEGLQTGRRCVDSAKDHSGKNRVNRLKADDRRAADASESLSHRTAEMQEMLDIDDSISRRSVNRTIGPKPRKEENNWSDQNGLKRQTGRKSEMDLQIHMELSPLEQERRELRVYMNRLPKAWTDPRKESAFFKMIKEEYTPRSGVSVTATKELQISHGNRSAMKIRHLGKRKELTEMVPLTSEIERPYMKIAESQKIAEPEKRIGRTMMQIEKSQSQSTLKEKKEETLTESDSCSKCPRNTEKLRDESQRKLNMPLRVRRSEKHQMSMDFMNSTVKNKGKWKL